MAGQPAAGRLHLIAEGGAWYANPRYVGLGVIILLLVVLISVSAARRA
jgi:hypothetical protein